MTIETQQIVKIFSEVQDLSAQYKAEVPSNRGAWPVSIRERITKLRELNVPALAIARKTGIPTPTIYSWEKKAPSFIPLRVLPEPAPTEKQVSVPHKPLTITVILSEGIRLEGLDTLAVIEVLRGLRK